MPTNFMFKSMLFKARTALLGSHGEVVKAS